MAPRNCGAENVDDTDETSADVFTRAPGVRFGATDENSSRDANGSRLNAIYNKSRCISNYIPPYPMAVTRSLRAKLQYQQ